MTEKEDQTKFNDINPALNKSGWQGSELVQLQYVISEDQIEAGNPSQEYRKKNTKQFADYLLRFNSVPLAILEAKPRGTDVLQGLEQAMNYARKVGTPFAFTTNGERLVGFNFLTNSDIPETSLNPFPTPQQLWDSFINTEALYSSKALLHAFFETSSRKPRYYQERATLRVIEAIENNQRRILITLATGTGKTFIALQIAWKLLKSGRMKRVLFLADRIALREQAFHAFEPFGSDRFEITNSTFSQGRSVYFGIYQTMFAGEEGQRLYQTLPRDYFDLIVIDEAHRSGFGTWNEILTHFNTAVQLGMTATPKRNDNVDTYGYFGDQIYSYSMRQGIEDGYLAPFRLFKILTNIDKNGYQHQSDKYSTKDFERTLVIPERTKAIVTDLTQRMKDYSHPLEKTIVFCVDQDHARAFAREMHNQMKYLGISDYVVPILSEERTAQEYLKQFSSPDRKTPVVVTSVDILTTGVDIPTARNVVLVRPVVSQSVFKQIIGRGTRIWESDEKTKLSFNILDYVGATDFMIDPAWMGNPANASNITGKTTKRGGTVPLVPPTPNPREKIVVQGVTVTIAETTSFLLTENGQRLSMSEYRNHALEKIRETVPDTKSLKTLWQNRDTRKIIRQALEQNGVNPTALRILFEAPESDELDLLAHLSNNEPLITREDRLTMLHNKHAPILEKYTKKQREIVEALLEKYLLYGIQELETTDVFSVSPLTRFGSLTRIAEEFGGAAALQEMILEVDRTLYA